ncbi:MAG: glycoside hydrolase family 127 protein, partial [Bacteroidales bacterium]|nr:glycoside hydrolase family 127 protein [Bacteroidales bacterium]
YYPSNMAYAPGHTVACCTGNINRFIPYYVMQMWMKTADNGIVASLFGPSELSTNAGSRDIPVTITQQTGYPFDEKIIFHVQPEKSTEFEFLIRIPEWCKDATVFINGVQSDQVPVPGTFFSTVRKWKPGDRVEVSLPMRIETRSWPHNGISIERGPIVFSLPVEDSMVIAQSYEKSTEIFPAYDIFPAGSWEYGLDLSDPEEVRVEFYMNDAYPWKIEQVPVRLKVPARRVLNWSLELVGEGESEEARFHVSCFPDEPVFSGEQQAIELVPYGTTQLRVTVFPDGSNE